MTWPLNTKRFLLTVDGDLVNVDYVVRIYEQGDKVFAAMANGSDIELKTNPDAMIELRRLHAINGVAP